MKKRIPLIIFLAGLVGAAEVPKAPVPKSPYLPVIYKDADELLERRATNLLQQQNLLRVLYTLSELSAKPVYRDAADAELKAFLANASPATHEFSRPWMLWDRCFELAPEVSKRFAAGLAQREIPDGRAGYYIRTWAVAYARTKDEQFLKAIEAALERRPAATLSFAIDCDGAAHRVPEPLASRLRALAAQQDHGFEPPKNLTAQFGMMCVSRYDNTGKPVYRDLILRAADADLHALLAEREDTSPLAFGHAISLQVAAWRHSAKAEYLERARKFADLAVEKFLGTNPPARAAGMDTLELALVELHLHILHITAVRCPPNTIDR